MSFFSWHRIMQSHDHGRDKAWFSVTSTWRGLDLYLVTTWFYYVLRLISVIGKSKKRWRDNSCLNELFSSVPYFSDNIDFSHIPVYLDEFFLTQKYVKEGLSARQIAFEISSSKTSVLNALRYYGIPIRESHKPHSHPSQTKFGEKIRKGKAVPHFAEKRAIDTVKLLKAEGLSLRKISAVLNEMKIPTKQRGKSWHPEMVRRILKV